MELLSCFPLIMVIPYPDLSFLPSYPGKQKNGTLFSQEYHFMGKPRQLHGSQS
jgi:hypothetical protein